MFSIFLSYQIFNILNINIKYQIYIELKKVKSVYSFLSELALDVLMDLRYNYLRNLLK